MGTRVVSTGKVAGLKTSKVKAGAATGAFFNTQDWSICFSAKLDCRKVNSNWQTLFGGGCGQPIVGYAYGKWHFTRQCGGTPDLTFGARCGRDVAIRIEKRGQQVCAFVNNHRQRCARIHRGWKKFTNVPVFSVGSGFVNGKEQFRGAIHSFSVTKLANRDQGGAAERKRRWKARQCKNIKSKTWASCLAAKEACNAAPDGVYKIAVGPWKGSVYCDQRTDGGGWALMYKTDLSRHAHTSLGINEAGLKDPALNSVAKLPDTVANWIGGVHRIEGVNGQKLFTKGWRLQFTDNWDLLGHFPGHILTKRKWGTPWRRGQIEMNRAHGSCLGTALDVAGQTSRQPGQWGKNDVICVQRWCCGGGKPANGLFMQKAGGPAIYQKGRIWVRPAGSTIVHEVPGLRAWFKADEGPIFATLGGQQKVSNWKDASGNENTLEQLAPGKRPTLLPGALNGKPVVRFDGQDDTLNNKFFVQNSHRFTVFALQRIRRFTKFRYSWSLGNHGPGFVAMESQGSRTTYDVAFGHGNDRRFTCPALNPQKFSLQVISGASKRGVTTWFNGQKCNMKPATLGRGPRAFSGNNIPNFQRITLGGLDIPNHPVNPEQTDIAELVVFSRVLSPKERVKVERYLAKKWGLSEVSNKPVPHHGAGKTCKNPATSCKAIKAANAQAPSGVYCIRYQGKKYKVQCDMTTRGGGWTSIIVPSNVPGYGLPVKTHGTTRRGNARNNSCGVKVYKRKLAGPGHTTWKGYSGYACGRIRAGFTLRWTNSLKAQEVMFESVLQGIQDRHMLINGKHVAGCRSRRGVDGSKCCFFNARGNTLGWRRNAGYITAGHFAPMYKRLGNFNTLTMQFNTGM